MGTEDYAMEDKVKVLCGEGQDTDRREDGVESFFIYLFFQLTSIRVAGATGRFPNLCEYSSAGRPLTVPALGSSRNSGVIWE